MATMSIGHQSNSVVQRECWNLRYTRSPRMLQWIGNWLKGQNMATMNNEGGSLQLCRGALRSELIIIIIIIIITIIVIIIIIITIIITIRVYHYY